MHSRISIRGCVRPLVRNPFSLKQSSHSHTLRNHPQPLLDASSYLLSCYPNPKQLLFGWVSAPIPPFFFMQTEFFSGFRFFRLSLHKKADLGTHLLFVYQTCLSEFGNVGKPTTFINPLVNSISCKHVQLLPGTFKSSNGL